MVELEPDGLLSSVIPDFEFVLDDLAEVSTDALRHRPGPEFTRLALWLLASSSNADRLIGEAASWTESVERLHQEAPDDHRRAVMYLLKTVSLTPAQAKKIRKMFWMGPDKRVVTVEDIAFAGMKEERAQYRQLGLEEGLKKGVRTGREEGRKELVSVLRGLLLTQWKARFGKVPRTVQSRFAKAELKQLKQWAERLVTAKSASDVLR